MNDLAVRALPQEEFVLDTKRLTLHPLCMHDLPLSIALFSNTDMVKFVCDVFTPEGIEAHLPVEMKRGA